MTQRRVVISNDDGIDASGLDALIRALEGLAEVVVVAPDSPRSGVGHALTDGSSIRVSKRAEARWAVSGMPADCARIGLSPSGPLPQAWIEARQARQIWLVAGINHGANLGVDTYVSGTAAAAREAAILGFPALAISQYVGRHRQPDWGQCIRRAVPVLRELLEAPPRAGAFWNVNLPHPVDERAPCEIVRCEPDPSPQAVRYERRGEIYTYSGDYHNRPRLPGRDVDVCFGGRVAVSEIAV